MASPSNLPYGTALTGANANSWAAQILADLGAPQTAANINSLADWFAQEGGGGQNNPLNTTVVAAGATGAINSAGVQGYPTPADGIAATVQTLDQQNFSGIKSALMSGTGLIGDTSISPELSSWSGGGYSVISGNASDTAPGSATASNPPASLTSDLNPLSGLTGLVAPVTDMAKDFDDALTVFHFLTGGPSAWLRVGAFFTGVLLLAGAAWCFVRASDDAPLIPPQLASLAGDALPGLAMAFVLSRKISPSRYRSGCAPERTT